MDSLSENSKASRAGTWLGHAWLRILRQEKQLAAWLAKKGVPASLANALPWTIKLVLVVAALYFALLAALIVAAFLIVAYLVSHAELSRTQQDKHEWRYGIHGFGLYDGRGFRIDPYDPNDEH